MLYPSRILPGSLKQVLGLVPQKRCPFSFCPFGAGCLVLLHPNFTKKANAGPDIGTGVCVNEPRVSFIRVCIPPHAALSWGRQLLRACLRALPEERAALQHTQQLSLHRNTECSLPGLVLC